MENRNGNRQKTEDAIRAALQLLSDGQLQLIWWIIRELVKG